MYFLFAENSLFRSATYPMPMVIVIYSGGGCPHPDPGAMSDSCNCLCSLVFLVFGCCVYHIDKKDAWILHLVCCHSQLTRDAHCVWAAKHCPIPFTLPLVSPMGRLLSSWLAHGEKRGRGKGMGQCIFCLHRTLCLGLPHTQCSVCL